MINQFSISIKKKPNVLNPHHLLLTHPLVLCHIQVSGLNRHCETTASLSLSHATAYYLTGIIRYSDLLNLRIRYKLI